VPVVRADHLGGGIERNRSGVEWGSARGHRCEGVNHALLQQLGSGEEHLALVSEVAEERSGRDAGSLGDLGDRRLLVAAFDVQVERCLGEASRGSWLPSSHS
jgi:hypothetical protein